MLRFQRNPDEGVAYTADAQDVSLYLDVSYMSNSSKDPAAGAKWVVRQCKY